jgi:hypothetical protein
MHILNLFLQLNNKKSHFQLQKPHTNQTKEQQRQQNSNKCTAVLNAKKLRAKTRFNQLCLNRLHFVGTATAGC